MAPLDDLAGPHESVQEELVLFGCFLRILFAFWGHERCKVNFLAIGVLDLSDFEDLCESLTAAYFADDRLDLATLAKHLHELLWVHAVLLRGLEDVLEQFVLLDTNFLGLCDLVEDDLGAESLLGVLANFLAVLLGVVILILVRTVEVSLYLLLDDAFWKSDLHLLQERVECLVASFNALLDDGILFGAFTQGSTKLSRREFARCERTSNR